ncbi:MAG: GAF and ANTAR domain-containing protein [bacterium]
MDTPEMKRSVDYEEQIRALTEISKAITSELYLDDILKLVVTVTAEVMDSKICSLWLLDEKKKVLRLRATQTISQEYLKERSLGLGEGVVGQVASTRIPMCIRDVQTELKYKEKEMARKEGLTSMLSVPLVVKDSVIGVINCYSQTPHDYTDTEVNLLIAVANQAAVAIVNTELMVKTRVIQEELESRKLVERAKEVLMARRGVTAAEAFRRMQKQSMNTRRSMREIAEAILLAEEI